MSLTGDIDVERVAPLVSVLTPVVSAVCCIRGFDGTEVWCRRLPGTDALADLPLHLPHQHFLPYQGLLYIAS